MSALGKTAARKDWLQWIELADDDTGVSCWDVDSIMGSCTESNLTSETDTPGGPIV
jgi:hypothetical protein